MTPRRKWPGDTGRSGKHTKESLAVSWWLVGSAPDQRAAFIAAAKVRQQQRLEKYQAVYGDAPTAEAK